MTGGQIERCIRAMEQLVVSGCPDRPVRAPGDRYLTSRNLRMKAIEDAIALINGDGITALADTYIGIKNYGGFGDQREDYHYNCCPRHGTIVFSIKRHRADAVFGAKEIFLLECVRDFSAIDAKQGLYQPLAYYNLCRILSKLQDARREEQAMLQHLASFTPDPECVERYHGRMS